MSKQKLIQKKIKKIKTRKHNSNLHPYSSLHSQQFSSRKFIEKFRLFFSTKDSHKNGKHINLNSSVRNYFLNKRKSNKKNGNNDNHNNSNDNTSSNDSVIEKTDTYSKSPQRTPYSKSPQRTPETPKTSESPKTFQAMKISESPNTPPTPSSSNPNNEMSNSIHQIDGNSNDNDYVE